MSDFNFICGHVRCMDGDDKECECKACCCGETKPLGTLIRCGRCLTLWPATSHDGVNLCERCVETMSERDLDDADEVYPMPEGFEEPDL